jgi:hypothetical protein
LTAYTLDVPRPQVLQLEQIAEQFSCAVGDHHDVRLGDALQACREVGGLANDGLLLSRTCPDQIADHDEPGRDADTGL